MNSGYLPRRDQVLALTAASFLISATSLIYSACHPLWLKDFFLRTSYYFIFALVLLWVFTLVKSARCGGFDILKFLKLHYRAILAIVFFTLLVFLMVPGHYRVLSDETNILSVARSMAFDQRVDNVTQAIWLGGQWHPVSSILEMRPFLFPFFIHLLHACFGFRPENVYILNFFALGGLLLSVYLILRAYLSEIWSLAAVILILSQPIICLSAASASYEIFNAFFIALSFLSLRWFLSTRQPIAFELLFFNLLLLANIRYESVLFLVVIMVFLCAEGYLKKELFLSSPVFIFSPVFLAALCVQKVLNFVNHQQLVVVAYRVLDHWHPGIIGKHLYAFFKGLSNLDGSSGYAGALNWLGIAAFIYFVSRLLFKKDQGDQRFLFLLSSIILLIHFIAVLSYGGGMAGHPMNGRYYFPEIICLSVLPVVWAASFNKSRSWRIGGLLCALIIFVFYFPQAAQDKMLARLPRIRENIYINRFLSQHAGKNDLIICGMPWEFAADRRGAIRFITANKDEADILQKFKGHLFGNIYVFQSISYETGKPFTGYDLDPSYHLKVLEQVPIVKKGDIEKNQASPEKFYFLRISQAIE